MKHFFKTSLSISLLPIALIACSSNPPSRSVPESKRIYIPQEEILVKRYIPRKEVPASYYSWIAQNDHLSQVTLYENYLKRHDVNNVVPMFELLRSARDWQKCGRSEYAVPHREVWQNQIETLRVIKYLVASKILTDYTITSVYRDSALNKCAGGASASRHVFNSAIDFRIGPAIPNAEDYVFIESTKFKLCEFWKQYGQDFNMGLGMYSSGQIHIDTQGYRTWGPSHSKDSSMCL